MQLVDQGLVAEVNGKKLFDFTPAVSVGGKKENEFHISLKRINKKKHQSRRIVLYHCTPLKIVSLLCTEQLAEYSV